MTVGKLRELLANIDDDVEIVVLDNSEDRRWWTVFSTDVSDETANRDKHVVLFLSRFSVVE